MNEHTEGPWSVKIRDDSVPHKAFIEGPNGWNVAEVFTPNTPIGEANTRLIAAAPELLEALQQLADIVDADDMTEPHFHEPLQKARSAIARAEGDQ